jgi:glycosyltransferase involved in cell wall biosynthesis
MKIAHLLGWYFPDSVGGTEVYVEGLCRRLVKAGHLVRIAAPTTDPSLAREYRHEGVPVFRFRIPSSPTRDEAYQRVPVRGADTFYAWLAAERPDVLHVHSFTTGIGLPEIREAVRLGIRVIATCHLPGLGYMCRTGELMQWGRTPCDGIVIPSKCSACSLTRLGLAEPLARIVGAVPVQAGNLLRRLPGRIGAMLGTSASVVERTSMQRELFELIERFVVLNTTAERMLVANGSPAAKLAINRLGLSHEHVVAKPGPDERPTTAPVRFGYVGRLHPTKGLTPLIRAVRATPAEVPFVLDVRGPVLDDGTRRYVNDLRALADGDSRVRFEPGVPAAQVPDVLAALDVLVCPSVWFENGPTVAIEAFAAGTPVVGSRVGNLAELVDDDVNGRLVAAGDVAAWSRAIAEVALDPRGTVDRWRRRLPAPRTMDDIAGDYLAMYAA